VFDSDRLLDDEYRNRLNAIYKKMDSRGQKALFVYGDASEHAELAYLTNFIPRMRWAMAMLPRDGEPRLVISISSRDMPAMRTMTWIKEVYSGWEWKHVDQWIATLKESSPSGTVGALGFELMPEQLRANVARSLGKQFVLEDASDLIGDRSVKRPRELSLIRHGCGITEAALSVFKTAWVKGRDPERAALAAERHARMNAAQDVRTLVSFNEGRTLEPYRGNFNVKTGSLLGYIAVKYAGYWSDGFVNIGAPPYLVEKTRRALDTLIGACRPGVIANALPRDALAQLGSENLHPALGDGVGHAIGLSLHDGPEFDAKAHHLIKSGAVYTLQAGLADAHAGVLASALVHVTDRGSRVLVHSVLQ
jgi:Xaa-Pro aminopeptidase